MADQECHRKNKYCAEVLPTSGYFRLLPAYAFRAPLIQMKSQGEGEGILRDSQGFFTILEGILKDFDGIVAILIGNFGILSRFFEILKDFIDIY